MRVHLIFALFDCCTDQFEEMAAVDFWSYMLMIIKYARWIQPLVSVSDHDCGIRISSILDTVFRYLPIFLTVLRYCSIGHPPP